MQQKVAVPYLIHHKIYDKQNQNNLPQSLKGRAFMLITCYEIKNVNKYNNQVERRNNQLLIHFFLYHMYITSLIQHYKVSIYKLS